MPSLPPELISAQDDSNENPLKQLVAEIDEFGCGEWTVLYNNDIKGNRFSYSALLSSAQITKALQKTEWDLSIGDGVPQLDISEKLSTYKRFGVNEIEPLLHVRYFNEIKPEQLDLSEEFRLFHNLYHDRRNDRFIHVDNCGNEVVVSEIYSNCARVLTRFLHKYLEARQATLVLFFDHYKACPNSDLSKLGIPLSEYIITDDRCYRIYNGVFEEKAFLRLIGKKIISPEAMEHDDSNQEKKKYMDFIIGVDKRGNPLEHNCNPEGLANFFGANEHAPNYSTPVWFKRNVLSKYYSEPNKFSVGDGYISCGYLWRIRIDNNLSEHIAVYLGDLGSDLHYEEQKHWKQFNITPAKTNTSKTNFRRSFDAKPTDPSEPDLLFKQRYDQLNQLWLEKFGWRLFLPLHKDDAHIFKQFRVQLVSENRGEFDEQVLFLAKLVIDSLNEDKLKTSLSSLNIEVKEDEKGITKFEKYLTANQYTNVKRDIGALRNLQSLRNGSAHRKGTQYDKKLSKVNDDHSSLPQIFRKHLSSINDMLCDLLNYSSD